MNHHKRRSIGVVTKGGTVVPLLSASPVPSPHPAHSTNLIPMRRCETKTTWSSRTVGGVDGRAREGSRRLSVNLWPRHPREGSLDRDSRLFLLVLSFFFTSSATRSFLLSLLFVRLQPETVFLDRIYHYTGEEGLIHDTNQPQTFLEIKPP
jgi:hypothetical protein